MGDLGGGRTCTSGYVWWSENNLQGSVLLFHMWCWRLNLSGLEQQTLLPSEPSPWTLKLISSLWRPCFSVTFHNLNLFNLYLKHIYKFLFKYRSTYMWFLPIRWYFFLRIVIIAGLGSVCSLQTWVMLHWWWFLSNFQYKNWEMYYER